MKIIGETIFKFMELLEDVETKEEKKHHLKTVSKLFVPLKLDLKAKSKTEIVDVVCVPKSNREDPTHKYFPS